MISKVRFSKPTLSIGIATVVIIIQVLTLLLPRTPFLMAVIYGMPVVTTLLLISTRLFCIRIQMLVALLLVLAISFALALFTETLILNVVFSIATYSSAALLLMAWGNDNEGFRVHLIRTFWASLTVVAIVIVVVGFAQLVANGFPRLLPYRDFSPDEFVGPYGKGGHRLIPMVLAPLIFWVGSQALVRGRLSGKQVALLSLLLFGAVAPGSNATILIIVVTIFCYFGGVFVWRALRTGLRKMNLSVAMIGIGAVSVVGVALGTLFVTIGQEGIAHSAASLRSLNPSEIREGSNPKVRAMVETFTVLPKSVPLQPLVGVGLGNYSSWSQLLLSGVYGDRFLQGRGLPQWFPLSYGDEAWEHVLRHISPEMYMRFGRFYAESVATLPWSSWQSLYAEIGLVGLALLGLALLPVLGRLQVSHTDSLSDKALKMTIGLGLWFVALCAFVDNYFEYPYLMVPALLPLVLLGNAKPKGTTKTGHEKPIQES